MGQSRQNSLHCSLVLSFLLNRLFTEHQRILFALFDSLYNQWLVSLHCPSSQICWPFRFRVYLVQRAFHWESLNPLRLTDTSYKSCWLIKIMKKTGSTKKTLCVQTFSFPWSQTGLLCCMLFSTIYSLKIYPMALVSIWKKAHKAWFHFPRRGERMTPNPPLNGKITKPTCHGGTVCQACRLQHGCLTKAIRAVLRLHRAKACLSVCGWISVCTKRGEWREREREREEELLT